MLFGKVELHKSTISQPPHARRSVHATDSSEPVLLGRSLFHES